MPMKGGKWVDLLERRHGDENAEVQARASGCVRKAECRNLVRRLGALANGLPLSLKVDDTRGTAD